MQCLVLAAGYATRLYPLTENYPKPLLNVGEKTILDHCGEYLGRYKRPKRLLFVDAIPTTSVGKIDRSAVKTLFKS